MQGEESSPKAPPKTLLQSPLTGKPAFLLILHSLSGSKSEEMSARGPRTNSVSASFPVLISQEWQRSFTEISS